MLGFHRLRQDGSRGSAVNKFSLEQVGSVFEVGTPVRILVSCLPQACKELSLTRSYSRWSHHDSPGDGRTALKPSSSRCSYRGKNWSSVSSILNPSELITENFCYELVLYASSKHR